MTYTMVGNGTWLCITFSLLSKDCYIHREAVNRKVFVVKWGGLNTVDPFIEGDAETVCEYINGLGYNVNLTPEYLYVSLPE